jgi:hypothetical protein
VVWGERSAIEAAWRSGEAPDDVVGALDAVQVTAFLSANGVSRQVASSGKMLTASEIEAAADAVTVRVECWRGP